MNIPSGQTKKDVAKPNRQAIASLMVGILLLCPAISLLMLYLIYGVLWNQIINAVLLVAFEGITLTYGTINVIRGNEITKQLAQIALKKFGMGAATASIVGLILIFFGPIESLGSNWTIWLFLFIMMPRVLITGIPAGGIGGFILGSIWKYKRAAIIGGIVAEIIVAPVLFMMFSS